MFLSAAKVWLSFADAWQFVQYWPKPIRGSGADCGAGQSTAQPDTAVGPHPYQPQNQPSCDLLLSRTMTAEACESGSRCVTSMPAQAAAGYGYISLIIIAPSGTGSTSFEAATPPVAKGSCRFSFNHACISFEYQIRTGACVPKPCP